jgi:hypothetical protein
MRKFLGLMILLAVAGVAAFYFMLTKGENSIGTSLAEKEKITVIGKAGSEKTGFLHSESARKIFASHGIHVDARQAGSVEMVKDAPTGLDFLWPASQVNLEYFRMANGDILHAADIFNSPIVLYSWDIVTDALIARGIVEHRGGVYYVVDLSKLLSWIMAKKQWKDIGLNQLYGSMIIRTTDPGKSNSGNMFAALVANTLNNGEVVTADTLNAVLPKVRVFYLRLGHMERSSGVLFDMFLQQGVGAYPIIVGYENQIVEYSLAHREAIPLLKEKIRVLYPIPTVWATHPCVALTANGKLFLDVLKNAKIQKIAWEQHGFRSGILGVENDPSILEVAGLPRSIDGVIPTPNAPVMTTITDSLSF